MNALRIVALISALYVNENLAFTSGDDKFIKKYAMMKVNTHTLHRKSSHKTGLLPTSVAGFIGDIIFVNNLHLLYINNNL